jgi:diguanylate cyclase (GGDEF)-like protein
MSSSVPPDRHSYYRESKTLHRSTQELTLQMAELDAALTREESARFKQTLGGQQKVRVAGAIAMAVTSVFMREGALTTIAVAVGIAGAYLFVVLRMSSANVQSRYASRRDMIPLALADAVVVTAFAALAAGGGAEESILWILLAGAVAAPAMAYSFGSRTGVVSFVMFGAGYLTTDLLLMGLQVTHAEPMRIVATAALWGGIVWPFMRYMTLIRERLDSLRTYAKLAEVGDIGTSDLVTSDSDNDDFALIASSLQKVHARLSEQIGSDSLTGCANRRGVERTLLGACRMAKRRNAPLALAAIDIDFFKQINDTRGHPEGDRVLRQLATIMRSTARETDTVGRLGGDEFIVVLPDSDWRGAQVFADRLMHMVKTASFGPPGSSIPMTLSIGIAVADSSEQLEPDRLMGAADEALYEAKEAGRNRIAGSRIATA